VSSGFLNCSIVSKINSSTLHWVVPGTGKTAVTLPFAFFVELGFNSYISIDNPPWPTPFADLANLQKLTPAGSTAIEIGFNKCINRNWI